MKKVVPLSSGFMLTSIVGFFVAVLFVMKLSPTWGLTFAIFFVLMFVASIINMGQVEAGDEHAMEHLAIHEKGHYQKHKKK